MYPSRLPQAEQSGARIGESSGPRLAVRSMVVPEGEVVVADEDEEF